MNAAKRSKRTRRKFTGEFKAKVALEALKARETINQIATRFEVHPHQVTQWKQQLLRQAPVVTDDFPATPLIENVGVRPDVQIDYMTKDNLLKSGRPFVDAFTKAITDEIKKQQQK